EQRVSLIAAAMRRSILRNPGFRRGAILEWPQVMHEAVVPDHLDHAELLRLGLWQTLTHCHGRLSVQFHTRSNVMMRRCICMTGTSDRYQWPVKFRRPSEMRSSRFKS